MNIHMSQDYRKILRELVAERQQTEPRFTFQELAAAARIQKSYMSKVITGRAHLTSDQMYLICRHLDLDSEAARYLDLLLERERTGVEMRRHELTRQIEAARSPHLESQAHIKADPISATSEGMAEYYLDPLNQIIHVCLFIESYRNDPSQLAKDLGQPMTRIQVALNTLERLGVVKKQGKKLALLVNNLHLKRQSPVYRPWRNQLKLLSMAKLDTVREADSYSFANVFSGDRATLDGIRVKFLQFLAEADGLVKAAPDKNVFQMSFDLFPWTERRET